MCPWALWFHGRATVSMRSLLDSHVADGFFDLQLPLRSLHRCQDCTLASLLPRPSHNGLLFRRTSTPVLVKERGRRRVQPHRRKQARKGRLAPLVPLSSPSIHPLGAPPPTAAPLAGSGSTLWVRAARPARPSGPAHPPKRARAGSTLWVSSTRLSASTAKHPRRLTNRE